MRIILVSAAVLFAITSATLVRADTDKLDDIAACAGVVLGNGAVDFSLGDEASFDAAAEVSYSAYLAEILNRSFSQNDLQIADQILGGNLDKVINAYNSETFDNEYMRKLLVAIANWPCRYLGKSMSSMIVQMSGKT